MRIPGWPGFPPHAQSDQASLEVLLEEDALLGLGPVDVLLGDLDLEHAAVRDGREEVEEGANWRAEVKEVSSPGPGALLGAGMGMDGLSLAVFAFARCSIRDRDERTTSARAGASLRATGWSVS